MTFAVQTAAGEEPIAVTDAAGFCRVDDDVATKDASLFPIFIKSARAAAEQELGRWLITQTIDAYFDRFPCGNYADPLKADYAIRLPPLTSVTEIVYLDGNGASQTLATDQYDVDASSGPRFSRIEPSYGNAWPSARLQLKSVRVRFIAGYGAAAAVPGCVKNWMLLRIKELYDNRDTIVIGTNGLVELPSIFIDSLLDPERVQGRP